MELKRQNYHKLAQFHYWIWIIFFIASVISTGIYYDDYTNSDIKIWNLLFYLIQLVSVLVILISILKIFFSSMFNKVNLGKKGLTRMSNYMFMDIGSLIILSIISGLNILFISLSDHWKDILDSFYTRGDILLEISYGIGSGIITAFISIILIYIAAKMVDDEGGMETSSFHLQIDNQIKCANCGTTISPNVKYCGNCGKEIEKKCSSCNKIYPIDSNFCPHCGAKNIQ
jgi:RNA polymerase subunit RPABC4/transcription elongation factor Spt4